MRAMASSLLSSLKSHPFITAGSVVLLFAVPIFHVLMFFWPLIVSTVLGVLAVVSFGRQSDEHVTATARCNTAESATASGNTAESASQPEIVAFSSHEEKISNVLMVDNQEVTWLEWLHNEDTQKLCTHEPEPAVWDVDGCDGISMPSEAGDASACKHEVLEDASLQAKDEGRPYVRGSESDGQMPVCALVLTEEVDVLTEEDETAAVPPSTVLNRIIKGTDIALALALEDPNKEEAKMEVSITTAEDKTNLHSTGENRMCKTNLDLTGDGESSTHAPVCAEGHKDQRSIEGLCLAGGGGNDRKTMQGSAIHAKDEVSDCASEGGGNVMGISECTNKCNIITKSLASSTDIKSILNTDLLEDETSLPLAVSKLGETGVHALEFLSVTEAISHTSEPKLSHTHEQHALDSPFSNKNISPLSEMKGAEVHEMQDTDEQDEGARDSNQSGPQWDVSEDEEYQSSLRFSFFQNSFLTPSGA